MVYGPNLIVHLVLKAYRAKHDPQSQLVRAACRGDSRPNGMTSPAPDCGQSSSKSQKDRCSVSDRPRISSRLNLLSLFPFKAS